MYEVDEKDQIIQKWIPKNRDDENVLTVKVFPKDFHVSSNNFMPRNFKRKARGNIRKFSFGSIKRLRFLLRNAGDVMAYEVGLTYPKEFPNDGLIVKKHFHKLRMRLNYYGYKFIWVLEFQGRGAPHFHMLINKEIKIEELSKMWFKIVASGDIKHLKRGVHVEKIRSKDRMAKYFANYLSKQDQKLVPLEYQNVGRFWGSSRNLLNCTIKKFYGNMEDIRQLKKQMRPLKRWFEAQKRSWSKRRKVTGKKPHKNTFVRPGVAFKVINSNLFIDEIRKRGLDTQLYEN
ncbi:MAG: hypothetical protein JWN37_603 [Candidatus Nomurabacteria bacterium]|nr:hypothetical protein [Candidatus Nomurabacteria bacterium]